MLKGSSESMTKKKESKVRDYYYIVVVVLLGGVDGCNVSSLRLLFVMTFCLHQILKWYQSTLTSAPDACLSSTR